MPTDAPNGLINQHVVSSRKQEQETDLSKLRKAELVEVATEQGVDTDGLTKAEILEALQPEGDAK